MAYEPTLYSAYKPEYDKKTTVEERAADYAHGVKYVGGEIELVLFGAVHLAYIQGYRDRVNEVGDAAWCRKHGVCEKCAYEKIDTKSEFNPGLDGLCNNCGKDEVYHSADGNKCL